VDSVGGGFTTAGGFGINYGILTKDKNGLTPGQAYKAWARTWCDPAGGPYRADAWNGPVLWNQPTTIRIGNSIVADDIVLYPNPTRGVFYIVKEGLKAEIKTVYIYNVLGECILQQKNTKEDDLMRIDLSDNPKGIVTIQIIFDDESQFLQKIVLQ